MEFKGIQDEYTRLQKEEEAATISYLKIYKNHRFKNLDLSNHYIFPKSAKLLYSLIISHFSCRKQLKSLILQNCMITTSILTSLLKILMNNKSSISLIDISNNKLVIEPIHSEAISILYSNSLKLKSLSLKGNICSNAETFKQLYSNEIYIQDLNLYAASLSSEALVTLSKILSLNKTIIKLNLGYNSSAFENFVNVNIFACSISDNSTIEYLNLNDNISFANLENLKQLCVGIKNNRSLKTLHLAGNDLGDMGIEILFNSLLKETAIPRLDISNNSIQDHGFILLLENFPATLTHLDLSYNNIQDNSSIIVFSQFLKETKSLRKINISHSIELENFNDSCTEIFCAAITENDSLAKILCEGIKINGNPDEFCAKFSHAIEIRKLSLEYKISASNCQEKNSTDSIISDGRSIKFMSNAPSNAWAFRDQISNSNTERKDYIESPNQEPIIDTSRQFTFSTSFE